MILLHFKVQYTLIGNEPWINSPLLKLNSISKFCPANKTYVPLARFSGGSREVGLFSYLSLGKGLSHDSFIALVQVELEGGRHG